MNRYDDRWYHGYLFLVILTLITSIVVALMSEWTTTPFILAFGIMTFFSVIGFLAESAVYGLSAKAGSFFWTAVTLGLACHFIPFPS